jgi:hypothetical protein
MQKKLLDQLSHELWQTETSASQHNRREAERLGDTPPARALLAVAAHADTALKTLPTLSLEPLTLPNRVSMAVGKVFSEVRDTFADKLLTSERSYRGTLLGMRHGVDVVKSLLANAQRTEQSDLIAFLQRWLSERQPLVAAVEGELDWFAAHPEQAVKPARGVFTKPRSLRATA